MRKYIKRHDVLARVNHWTFAVGGILLALTGLPLFIDPLGALLDPGFFKVSSTIHHILGGLFVAIPVLSWIIRPSNFIHSFKNIFRKWDAADKEFMRKFPGYLFNPKKYHMPKQHFVKSGQRLSDAGMYLCIFFISITGLVMWLGGAYIPPWLFSLALFGHDLSFLGMGLIFVVHVYLGGGIFQPYRRSARMMFGDGYVAESDALYHWGYWAEEELTAGKNVVIREE